MGSWILSLRDLHQVKAPDIGGIFKKIGADSWDFSTKTFPSKKMD